MNQHIVEPDLSPCTSMLSCILTFRIVILAWNRPCSLQRLLSSLERSDYSFVRNNPGWDLLVEIRVDGGGGEEGEEVKRIAKEWRCGFGNKVRDTGKLVNFKSSNLTFHNIISSNLNSTNLFHIQQFEIMLFEINLISCNSIYSNFISRNWI